MNGGIELHRRLKLAHNCVCPNLHDARRGHKIRILSTISIVFFLLFEAQ